MLTRSARASLLLSVLLATPLATISTQTTAPASPSPVGGGPVGTILIAHGGDSAWNARVIDLATQVHTGGPVEVSFLMGPFAPAHRFQDAVARLERAGVSSIVVVPVLVSSHSGHFDQVRYLAGEPVSLDSVMTHHLHMSGIERPVTTVPLHLTRAMDDAPELAEALADRALAATGEPAHRALFLVGHGPNSAEDYAAWMENLRVVADSVRRRTGFRDVRVDMVRDDAPAPVRAEAVRRIRELIGLQHDVTGRDVIVVPVVVSSGTVNRATIPADLRDLRVVYAPEPLLPHAALARWVERRVRAAAAGAEPLTTRAP
jgi:sirohydrochlorin cobaltochelatase